MTFDRIPSAQPNSLIEFPDFTDEDWEASHDETPEDFEMIKGAFISSSMDVNSLSLAGRLTPIKRRTEILEEDKMDTSDLNFSGDLEGSKQKKAKTNDTRIRALKINPSYFRKDPTPRRSIASAIPRDIPVDWNTPIIIERQLFLKKINKNGQLELVPVHLLQTVDNWHIGNLEYSLSI